MTATLLDIKTKGIELFKAGQRRDSQGREKAWTRAELDEMAEAYNASAGKHHDAPVLVGHDGRSMELDMNLPAGSFEAPTIAPTGEAAYGWLEKVYREGNVLKGDYSNLNPDFAKALQNKQYRKRSISIYPPNHPDNPTPGKLNIRHLAYVGIPAVKGLADHSEPRSGFDFGEDSGEFYNYEESTAYAETTMKTTAKTTSTFTNLDEFMAAWKEADKADNPDMVKKDLYQAAKKMKLALPQAAKDWWKKNGMKAMIASKQFSETSDFMGLNQVAEIFTNLRDQIIADKGLDEAEQSIPKTSLEMLRNLDQSMPNQMAFQMLSDRCDQMMQMLMEMKAEEDAEDDDDENQLPPLQSNYPDTMTTNYEELKTQCDQLTSDLAASRKEIANLSAHKLQLEAQAERDRVTNFVEGLVNQRKVLPVDKADKIALLLVLPNDRPVEFGEGDAKVSVTPRQALMNDLEKGRELWSASKMPTGAEYAPDFAESQTRSDIRMDADSVALDGKIRAYCAQNKLDPNKIENYTEAMGKLEIYV